MLPLEAGQGEDPDQLRASRAQHVEVALVEEPILLQFLSRAPSEEPHAFGGVVAHVPQDHPQVMPRPASSPSRTTTPRAPTRSGTIAPPAALTRAATSTTRAGPHDSGHGPLLLPRLTILDANGTELQSVSSLDAVQAQGIAASRTSLTLAFVPAIGGTYLVRVEDVTGSGGAELTYWLELR